MIWAHPRSRGENVFWASIRSCVAGSSPLTRGKPPVSDFAPYRVGLIPAHAGKTLRTGRKPSKRWAHPRSRGENPVQQGALGLAAGSSPLTRGKRRLPASVRRRAGLIPAHAGKTCSPGSPRP